MSAQKPALDDAIARIYEAQAIVAVVGFAITHEQSLETEDTRTRLSSALAGAEKLLEDAGTVVGKAQGVYS